MCNFIQLLNMDTVNEVDSRVSEGLRASYSKSIDQMRITIAIHKELAESLTSVAKWIATVYMTISHIDLQHRYI